MQCRRDKRTELHEAHRDKRIRRNKANDTSSLSFRNVVRLAIVDEEELSRSARTKGKDNKVVSIRTTQDRSIAFPRIEGDKNWRTLDEVDAVVEFYPSLAFESEFVEGRFDKLNLATELERERVNALFWKNKIFYTIDMSVCLTDGKITKAIDFAMKDIELWAI